MAPKKPEKSANGEASAADDDIVVTPNELKLIMTVLRSTTRSGKPWLSGHVNWNAASAELKLKSGKTAQDRMCQKFGLFEAEEPAAAEAVAPSAKGADGKAKKATKAPAASKAKGKGKGKRPADDVADDGAPADDDQGDDDLGDDGDAKDEGAWKKRTKKAKTTKSE